MTLARRYLLLQRVVFVQGACCVLLALYVVCTHKKSYPLNVTVHESPAPDLSYLAALTNRPPAALAASPLPAPVVGGGDAARAPEASRLPVRFDGYSVVAGRAAARLGVRVFFEGDMVLGRPIQSIDPMGVVIDGLNYSFVSDIKGGL